jgi:LAGLIDADG endonuclease
LDGDGNFDLRGDTLKSIRIKLHKRDIRILNRIRNTLHVGKIIKVNKTNYVLYRVSAYKDMKIIIEGINGHMRIKRDSFKKACSFVSCNFLEAKYTIDYNDPYFSGLVDTDGSIVFNFVGNRIECNLEFKYDTYSSQLNFDNILGDSGCKPSVLFRMKKNTSSDKNFPSIAFKFQTVKSMEPLYKYFMKNRLYSDFKFYRISRIKSFLKIRHYNKRPFDSKEYKAYSKFLLN